MVLIFLTWSWKSFVWLSLIALESVFKSFLSSAFSYKSVFTSYWCFKKPKWITNWYPEVCPVDEIHFRPNVPLWRIFTGIIEYKIVEYGGSYMLGGSVEPNCSPRWSCAFQREGVWLPRRRSRCSSAGRGQGCLRCERKGLLRATTIPMPRSNSRQWSWTTKDFG